MIKGQPITLATITLGALEACPLAGKTGVDFNQALIKACIVATGVEPPNDAWFKSLTVFSPDETEPEFAQLVNVANKVNGFKAKQPGEAEPGAPA
jgi:hypothetical protein